MISLRTTFLFLASSTCLPQRCQMMRTNNDFFLFTAQLKSNMALNIYPAHHFLTNLDLSISVNKLIAYFDVINQKQLMNFEFANFGLQIPGNPGQNSYSSKRLIFVHRHFLKSSSNRRDF
jgi:hypothetical protein